MKELNLEECNICPRGCRVNRLKGECGVCMAAGSGVYLARAALHFWEEPCISGSEGSGAVFFSGCSLHCIFCQNRDISLMKTGREVTVEQLSDVFLMLQEKGALNINLVTPTHYALQIREALILAKEKGLSIPVAYNCSGYERVETLQALSGLVDIYLTDFKYMEADIAEKYSHAADYPEVCKAALSEMVRQVPECVFDEHGIMKRGVIVRHLLMPGHVKNAKAVAEYVYHTYGDRVYLSLMSQYTPMGEFPERPELSRMVTEREYERLLSYVISLGVTNSFIQEGRPASESFIPAFDYEGVPERE